MCATAVLCLFFVLGSPPGRGDVERVEAILAGANAEPPASAEALKRELARLGTAAIPDLVTVLASTEEHAPSPLQAEALVSALTSFGARPLRAFCEQRLAQSPGTAERGALLTWLARAGAGEDLSLAQRIAGKDPSDLAAELQAAVAGIVRRDSRALDPVRRWVLQVPTETGSVLVRALGASGSPAALPVLAELLGQDADLDPVLLTEIAGLAVHASKPIEERVLEPLLETLQGDDALILREAALAVGRTEDSGAAARLIELLNHEDAGVQEAAGWALERITGLRLRADPARWSSWLGVETRWFVTELPRLRQELRSRRTEIAVRALGEISRRRLRRHELALETTSALEHESSLVRRLACATLQRLGSQAAVPALLPLLQDSDESVSRAARAALAGLGAMPDPGAEAGAVGNPPAS